MRKFLIAFMALFLMAPSALFSQNVLRIHLKNGLLVDLAFKLQPVLTFTDNDVVLTVADGKQVTYPLASLTKFSFVMTDLTEVEEIIEEEVRKVSCYFDEYTVNITGAQADMVVRLISSDGRQINAFKTDKEGSVSFSIAELPAGVYIINSEDITFKILKK